MAALAGVGAALCWLPTGLAPLFPLVFLLMARALRRVESGRDALLVGLVFGALRYAASAHFLLALTRYSVPVGVAFYLLAILSILPIAALEGSGALFLERRLGVPRGLAFGLIYVLGEKLRTLGDLSFPADHLAHAFGTDPAWLGLAPFVGPFGVSLTIMVVAALLDAAVESAPRWSRVVPWAAAALALWIAAPLTTLLRPPVAHTGAATLTVGIVQPNAEVTDRADPARRAALLETLRAMTLDAARGGAELVVWPEAATPGAARILADGSVDDPPVTAIAREARVPILYGTVLAEFDGREVAALYNGAALALPDGTIADWYGKQRLLPFAEGLPFAKYFGLTPRERARRGPRQGHLSLLGNFTPGERPTIFRVGSARIGVLICFEAMYAGLGRAYDTAGANALVVLTNDSWWGRSAFAPWHARMAAARVRESGIPLLRAANGGVSSITDASGRLGAHTGLLERRVLQVRLEPVDAAPTFYARFGDWILLLVLAVPALARRRARVPVPVL